MVANTILIDTTYPPVPWLEPTWYNNRLFPTGKLTLTKAELYQGDSYVRAAVEAIDEAGVVWDASYPSLLSEMTPLRLPPNFYAIYELRFAMNYGPRHCAVQCCDFETAVNIARREQLNLAEREVTLRRVSRPRADRFDGQVIESGW